MAVTEVTGHGCTRTYTIPTQVETLMAGSTFALALPSNLRMLSVARGFVEAVAEANQLDRATLHALMIVTGEAVTNIVRHAHHHRAAAQMEIHLRLFSDRVIISFRDQGEPFDLDSVPCLPPGELRLGGRGIFLMRTLMDELSYQPCDHGQPGNVLRLVKRCSIESAPCLCG